jgi:outer membrane protein, multidrug efflux system
MIVFAPRAHADEDPMLAPLAPASEQLRSWDDALARIRNAPDILATTAEIERASGLRRLALAAVLPAVVAVGGYQHSDNAPPSNVWSVVGNAAWSVDARSIYDVGTAGRAIDASRLTLAERKRELVAATIDTMLATLTAERIAADYRVALRASIDRWELAKTRFANSHGSKLDVDRAGKDVEAVRGLLVLGDEAVHQAREALGQLVGSPVPLAPTMDLDIEGFERAISTTCRANGEIEQRADVRLARTRLELAERGVTSAELRFGPSVGVSTQVIDLSTVPIGPTSNWTVAATVTIPLYDGGARYGAIRQARAEATEAHEGLAQARVVAIVDVARSDRSIDVAKKGRYGAGRELDLAVQVDAQVREDYAAGSGSSLDLVTTGQILRQAQIGVIATELQIARARAASALAHAECTF